jgi:hypothetical protein
MTTAMNFRVPKNDKFFSRWATCCLPWKTQLYEVSRYFTVTGYKAFSVTVNKVTFQLYIPLIGHKEAWWYMPSSSSAWGKRNVRLAASIGSRKLQGALLSLLCDPTCSRHPISSTPCSHPGFYIRHQRVFWRRHLKMKRGFHTKRSLTQSR